MSGTPGRVLITGGTGLIGGEVVATFLSRGWTVNAIARGSDDESAGKRIRDRLKRSGHRAQAKEPLTCRAGSVTEPGLGLPAKALEGITAILHCAGETAFNEDDRCWTVNVGAAERLVELGRSLKRPPRIYFVGTASVCMHPLHSEIQEDAPFGGYSNGYTRSKRRAEEILLGSGLDVVILRPTIVFSRGVDDRKMARSMLWVIPALIELGSAPLEEDSRIDIVPVDYAADAIERLLRAPALAHRRYHISAGPRRSATCGEFQETVSQVDPRARAVKLATRRARAGGDARANLLRERLEASISHYVPFMTSDIVYSNARLLEACPGLGESPKVTEYLHTLLGQFDYQEGIEESARP